MLREGETLSGLIEAAVRETLHRERAQAAFLERGLQSGAQARRSGSYHQATDVHDELQQRLDDRRRRTLG